MSLEGFGPGALLLSESANDPVITAAMPTIDGMVIHLDAAQHPVPEISNILMAGPLQVTQTIGIRARIFKYLPGPLRR